VVVGAAPEPFGPRLGIGVFAGATRLETEGTDDLGLAGRLRLTRGLSLDGELAKSRNGDLESRRAGIGLSFDLAHRSRLSPHILGMMGRWDEARYAEVGVGLTYRLSERLHISADLRAGALEEAAPAMDGSIARVVDDGGSANDPLRFTRGRVGAMLWF
jgi:hypothetical protein